MYKSYSWVIKKEYEDLIIIHWVWLENCSEKLMVLLFRTKASMLLLIELLKLEITV